MPSRALTCARRGAAALAAALLALVGLRLGNLWWIGRIGLYQGEVVEVAADPAAGFHWP